MSQWICPSILAADFTRLGDEVRNVLAAGADTIHFDVMDNHYVPNLSIGPLVLSSLRKAGIDACIDVHLMVKPVDRLVEDFLNAGADYITVHPESTEHLHKTLSMIHEGGAKAGLVFHLLITSQGIGLLLLSKIRRILILYIQGMIKYINLLMVVRT